MTIKKISNLEKKIIEGLLVAGILGCTKTYKIYNHNYYPIYYTPTKVDTIIKYKPETVRVYIKIREGTKTQPQPQEDIKKKYIEYQNSFKGKTYTQPQPPTYTQPQRTSTQSQRRR
ncbi:MAG: hypothetical protein QXQ30_00015 [Candidatus Pacearchaeota archaeon]